MFIGVSVYQCISLSVYQFISLSVVALAEAKDEDMDYGIAQCVAQMIGAQRFNAKSNKPTDAIWGCATTAGEWKFLKMTDNSLYVDTRSFYLDRLDVLLGVFDAIIAQI